MLQHADMPPEPTPEKHHGTQTLWSDLLEDQTSRQSAYDICNCEQHDRDVVIISNHMQLFRHSLNLRIADVASINEGDEHEEAKDWNNIEIKFSEDLLLKCRIDCGAVMLRLQCRRLDIMNRLVHFCHCAVRRRARL